MPFDVEKARHATTFRKSVDLPPYAGNMAEYLREACNEIEALRAANAELEKQRTDLQDRLENKIIECGGWQLKAEAAEALAERYRIALAHAAAATFQHQTREIVAKALTDSQESAEDKP